MGGALLLPVLTFSFAQSYYYWHERSLSVGFLVPLEECRVSCNKCLAWLVSLLSSVVERAAQ
jgi:hypothetical protein